MAKLGDSIDFAKYEGLGNDFILIDDRDKSDPSLTPEQSERLCNRNFGIGGDGVIFALKAPEGKTVTCMCYDDSMICHYEVVYTYLTIVIHQTTTPYHHNQHKTNNTIPDNLKPLRNATIRRRL